ncbi:acid protease [Cristinia sonorae]|uniref:Acid protease n=1 Tax=Cristinia sonorae TaxID=1940300 RepID=A0A8K0XQ51_9AGAR|nr:acid protease [Cristinia sonorae]
MQLAYSFVFLLASVLVSLSPSAQAAPAKRAELITLPLKRVHQSVPNIHPAVYLQQNINRGLRRHARMTGREAPSDTELKRNIHKRLLAIEEAELKKRGHEKRYNRHGVPKQRIQPSPDLPGAKALHLKGNNGGGANQFASTPLNVSTGDVDGDGFSQIDAAAQAKGGLTPAIAPTAVNSLGLDIEANDVGYIATVQIGTPPRDFKLLMDSGSSDLWVGAEGCQSEDGGDCGNHVFLGEGSSSSFADTGRNFQVTYGSGAVQGDIVTDDLDIAGLVLNAHTFGVATLESVEFSGDSTSFDGLMGLAQSSLSNQGVLTPVEALAQAGLIKDAVTSYKISRLSDGKNDGEISFGGLDPNKFDPATLVTFPNVNKNGFWEGAFTVSVDGVDLGLAGRSAILDTGTTLIIAPPEDAIAIHSAIPGAKTDGQGSFTIPCTTSASVALTFGGRSFDIKAEDLLFTPVDPRDLDGDCISGISSGNVGGDTVWLVGDVFLKNAYFSTDVGRNTMSLAELI